MRPNDAARRQWRLRYGGHEWVVVRGHEVRDGEREVRDPAWLPHCLSAAVTDVFARRTLLDLCAALWGDVGRLRDVDHVLLRRLEHEFRRGALALLSPAPLNAGLTAVERGGSGAPPRPGAPPAPSAPRASGASHGGMRTSGRPPTSAAPVPAKPTTWIGVRLMGADDRPIANERYRITAPDGAIREGRLDDAGEIVLDGIDPGTCRVSFPDLDAREWDAA
jgi:hypothetical protein